jgi:cytochrome P450
VFIFDVGRDPNKHLAFGYGVHFCLGAALARMEVNSFFSELLPRVKSVELTGVPQFTATTFVGGTQTPPGPLPVPLAGLTAGKHEPWIRKHRQAEMPNTYQPGDLP